MTLVSLTGRDFPPPDPKPLTTIEDRLKTVLTTPGRRRFNRAFLSSSDRGFRRSLTPGWAHFFFQT